MTSQRAVSTSRTTGIDLALVAASPPAATVAGAVTVPAVAAVTASPAESLLPYHDKVATACWTSHYVQQAPTKGTFDNGALMQCMEGNFMGSLGQGYQAEETGKLTFTASDLTSADGAACTIGSGLLKVNGNRKRAPLHVHQRACDRYAKALQNTSGWSCVKESGKYRIETFPRALTAYLLKVRPSWFSAKFEDCKDAITSVINRMVSGTSRYLNFSESMLLKSQSSLTKNEVFNLREVQRALKSYYSLLRDTYTQAFKVAKPLLGRKPSEVVFPAKGPLAQHHIGLRQTAPDSGCQGDHYSCPSGWRTLPQYIADVVSHPGGGEDLTKEGSWRGINSTEPLMGIMIPAKLAKVGNFCRRLANRVAKLAGWSCYQRRNLYGIKTAPPGLDLHLSPESWQANFPTCDAAIEFAAKPWKLIAKKMNFWADEKMRPIASVSEPRPKTPGVASRKFLACFPGQNQQKSFYKQLGQAAAAVALQA